MQSAIIPLHEIKENIIIRRIEESTSLNFKGTHRHNFYEILHFSYTEEGLTHSIDFKESVIQTNCIYMLKPGQVYHMNRTVQKGYLIAIKPEYLNSRGIYHSKALPSNWGLWMHLTFHAFSKNMRVARRSSLGRLWGDKQKEAVQNRLCIV